MLNKGLFTWPQSIKDTEFHHNVECVLLLYSIEAHCSKCCTDCIVSYSRGVLHSDGRFKRGSFNLTNSPFKFTKLIFVAIFEHYYHMQQNFYIICSNTYIDQQRTQSEIYFTNFKKLRNMIEKNKHLTKIHESIHASE